MIELHADLEKLIEEYSVEYNKPEAVAARHADKMGVWMRFAHTVIETDIKKELKQQQSYIPDEDSGYSYYNYEDYGDTFVMDGDDIVGDR